MQELMRQKHFEKFGNSDDADRTGDYRGAFSGDGRACRDFWRLLEAYVPLNAKDVEAIYKMCL